MSGLSGPASQFLNGTHELSELVLARMVLLMDQSRQVSLPFRSAKAREFGELWREKCTRAPDLTYENIVFNHLPTYGCKAITVASVVTQLTRSICHRLVKWFELIHCHHLRQEVDNFRGNIDSTLLLTNQFTCALQGMLDIDLNWKWRDNAISLLNTPRGCFSGIIYKLRIILNLQILQTTNY